MNKNSKISVVEAVLFGMVVVSADAIEALGVFAGTIPVLGQTLIVISWIYGVGVSAIVIFWLIMKGVSVKWFLWGNSLELFPILSALPARSVAFAATLIIDWAPEHFKKAIETATKITKPIGK